MSNAILPNVYNQPGCNHVGGGGFLYTKKVLVNFTCWNTQQLFTVLVDQLHLGDSSHSFCIDPLFTTHHIRYTYFSRHVVVMYDTPYTPILCSYLKFS